MREVCERRDGIFSSSMYENDLHRKHGGRNKLKTYRRFKHSFEWESYLTYIKSPPQPCADFSSVAIRWRLREADSQAKAITCRSAVLSKRPTTG